MVLSGLTRQSDNCIDLSRLKLNYSLHKLLSEYELNLKFLAAKKVSKTLTIYNPKSFCIHSTSFLHPCSIFTLFGSVNISLSLLKPPVKSYSLSNDKHGFDVLFFKNFRTSMT